MTRLKLHLRGAVQGVGFRPFIYRTAKKLGLAGYVANEPSGVTVEAEGTPEEVDCFLKIVETESPPLANITHRTSSFDSPAGYQDFEIRSSQEGGDQQAVLVPDISTCPACTEELLDPQNRRYRYPFINCTDCGPRFTLIEALPYDRSRTTMKGFVMCPACRNEYTDPMDRRFHAQPNACPDCGPHVRLTDRNGNGLARGKESIDRLLEAIRDGKIAAVKGIGGFHLVCNATEERSVEQLRRRKGRSGKPFAVMFRDVDQIRQYAKPTVAEELLLLSPERPIVIIRKKAENLEAVSPGLTSIGAFLPYSPLHTILLQGLSFPVVATSGNLSEEPIAKGNDEALHRLGPLSDVFLLHNRPIHRRCDDSVTRIVNGRPQIIRRARGFAATPILLPGRRRRKVLAVGGQLKNTFALAFDDQVIISPHIGDMESPESMTHFQESLEDLCRIYRFAPDLIVYDLHPGYATTKWALKQEGPRKTPLQHHFAHILSCMAEHHLEEKVTGIAWDGTGYGPDGTIWGGEVLSCDRSKFERRLHFRPFRLLGGEKAVREPRRVALSLLFELFGQKIFEMDLPPLRAFEEQEREVLFSAWKEGINSPLTSSAGRLFDGLSSLLGLIQIMSYEAEGAMKIEDRFIASVTDSYTYTIEDGLIDWRPLFSDLLQDKEQTKIPSRFINTLVRIIHDSALWLDEKKVCLSGGVFQNAALTERTVELLREEGFQVFTQRLVPANDGGLSLGQAYWEGSAHAKSQGTQ
jgi:hydrogenase maturation protein HypF